MTLSTNGFRTALTALTLTLLGLVVASIWWVGRTPTDENLFTRPPSAVALEAPLPPLEPGDLLLSINGASTRTTHEFDAVRAGLASGPATVLVARGAGPKLELTVDAAALQAAVVRDVAATAFVIEVAPGGASARAGMREGDLITRINGKTFGDVLEADAILRSGKVGRVTDYDILRDGSPLTLQVRLAAFGLRVPTIVMALAGLACMGFGLWLGLVRPAIPAARYLALAFVLLGYALAVTLLRRAPGDDPSTALQTGVVLLCLFMGLAVAFHAALLFPRERTSVLQRRWVLPGAYALAAASAALLSWRGSDALFSALLTLNLGYAALMLFSGRADLGPEWRRIQRPVLVARALVGLVLLVLGFGWLSRRPGGADGLGFVGFLLFAVPVLHLWVIGRHRLLELNLRMRRHVWYSLISTAWGLIPLAVLAWFILASPRLELPIPNIRLGGSAVEVLEAPLPEAARTDVEKVLLMLAAVGLAFALRGVSGRGQHWLANRFYRAEHDYRRAAAEVSRLVTARPSLEGLSTGLVEAVAKLLKVKRAGTIFFHRQQHYAVAKPHGFDEAAWQQAVAAAPDLREGVEKATSEVAAEYCFPRLRRLLTGIDVEYLYPLRVHDELVGVLILGEKRAEDVFRDEDFEFLGALASQVAPAIENAFLYDELAEQERMKHELEIARRIQMASLPQFTPSVQGLDIAGVSIPALEVGGDYFDYLNGAPGRLTVVVGDVSGKGTSAALYMSRFQGIVRSLHAFDLSPHEFFVRANDLLCRDLERRSFVTALGGFFDADASRLVLARAGHLPLYHFAASTGRVTRVMPRGLSFGLSTRAAFDTELQEQLVPYSPDDVFLFITDGITESTDPGGEDFGEDRVVDLLARHARQSAREIRDRMTEAVHEFSGGVAQFDDQTVVVVKAS